MWGMSAFPPVASVRCAQSLFVLTDLQLLQLGSLAHLVLFRRRPREIRALRRGLGGAHQVPVQRHCQDRWSWVTPQCGTVRHNDRAVPGQRGGLFGADVPRRLQRQRRLSSGILPMLSGLHRRFLR